MEIIASSCCSREDMMPGDKVGALEEHVKGSQFTIRKKMHGELSISIIEFTAVHQ